MSTLPMPAAYALVGVHSAKATCCPGPDNSTCLSPCAVFKDIINLWVLSPQFICMVGTI